MKETDLHHRLGAILRQRVLLNPMVLGAAAGAAVSLATRATDRRRPLHPILYNGANYLGSCVLGVALFNFGLFSHMHGVVSCGRAEMAGALLARFVLPPALNLPLMYAVGLRGDALKIMVMQAALPQAIAAFVMFKEFRLNPELFSTSVVLGTVLALPATCIWYFILERVVPALPP